MTMVTEAVVPAFASCVDARCAGYNQEPVDGVRTTTVWTYGDLGGDGTMAGFPERSTEMVRFADEDLSVCVVCGKPRLISEQVRPEYQNISGQDPMALYELGKTAGNVRDLQHQRELDLIKRDREMEDLRDQVAQLTAALTEPKRGPGRPRKEPEDGA